MNAIERIKELEASRDAWKTAKPGIQPNGEYVPPLFADLANAVCTWESEHPADAAELKQLHGLLPTASR